MRKYIYICVLVLFCAAPASAQFTLLSGTITDTNAVPYACGTISASIVNNNGQSLYLNGVQFSPQPGATKLGCPTDPSTSQTPGAYTMQLADNTQIKCGSGASIITCATQTQWAFTINSSGVPPPLGTGPQSCTTTATVTGTTQTLSLTACPKLTTTGGATPFGAQAFYATSFGVNPDWVFGYSVTCSNGSNVIQTGTNDPPFSSGDAANGKLIVGLGGGTTANCPPLGKIIGFTDAHHVTVSNPATATGTFGPFQTPTLAWGTQDDGANLRTGFLASLGKGCFYLPPGIMAAGIAGSDGKNLFIDTRTVNGNGLSACVVGQNSVITPLPTFNYANCQANDGCAFTWPGQGIAVNPNYALLKDWMLIGEGYNLTGNGTTNLWINWQRVFLSNVWVWGLGQGVAAGMGGAGPNYVFAPTVLATGNTGCSVTGNGAAPGGFNLLVTIEQGFCGGYNGSLTLGAQAALVSKGMQFNIPITSGPTVTVGTGAYWSSTLDGIDPGFGTADALRVNGNATASLHSTFVLGGAANTLGALNCNVTGGNILYDGGILDGGGTGGLAIHSVAGCNVKIRFPVTVRNYVASLAGNNVSDPSETQSGTCAANAATVTFNFTYQVAPKVNVSDTTSGSTGAQATSVTTTTATIHCNGATDTFVATVIPNPI